MRSRRQKKFDELLPTVVRYVGVGMAVGLAISNILGRGRDLSSGYIAAAGMMLYKTVKSAANNNGNNDS